MQGLKERLARLTPATSNEPDWDAVVRDARASRVRWAAPRLVLVGTVLGVALLFAIAPWRGGEHAGILDRALAAIGDGPVLHVVFRGEWGGTLVDLETGDRKPLHGENEVWYDPDRNLVHSIGRFGGTVEHEEVYVPQKPPPELIALTRQYRAALEDGTARVDGEGVVDDVPVYWVTFRRLMLPDVTDNRNHELAEHVAISRATFKPVATRDTRDGNVIEESFQRVLKLETMSVEQADFTADRSTMIGRAMMSGTTPTSFESALAILGRVPFWLGPEYAGLRLAQTQKARSAISQSVEKPQFGPEHTGVVFFYAQVGDNPTTFRKDVAPLFTKPHLILTQTTDRNLLVRGGPMSYRPPEGSVVLMPGPTVYLVRDGVYISIAASSEKLVLDAARALRPLTSAGSGAGG